MEFNFSEDDVPEDILNGTEQKLPDDLQVKLNEYNRNFDALNNYLGDGNLIGAGVATELRIEKTKEMLVQALPIAVRTVMELASYSLSDTIRLKAAMYIIERTMGKEPMIEVEDQATQLLRKLQV